MRPQKTNLGSKEVEDIYLVVVYSPTFTVPQPNPLPPAPSLSLFAPFHPFLPLPLSRQTLCPDSSASGFRAYKRTRALPCIHGRAVVVLRDLFYFKLASGDEYRLRIHHLG
jgi:hypothetical protein